MPEALAAGRFMRLGSGSAAAVPVSGSVLLASSLSPRSGLFFPLAFAFALVLGFAVFGSSIAQGSSSFGSSSLCFVAADFVFAFAFALLFGLGGLVCESASLGFANGFAFGLLTGGTSFAGLRFRCAGSASLQQFAITINVHYGLQVHWFTAVFLKNTQKINCALAEI